MAPSPAAFLSAQSGGNSDGSHPLGMLRRISRRVESLAALNQPSAPFSHGKSLGTADSRSVETYSVSPVMGLPRYSAEKCAFSFQRLSCASPELPPERSEIR